MGRSQLLASLIGCAIASSACDLAPEDEGDGAGKADGLGEGIAGRYSSLELADGRVIGHREVVVTSEPAGTYTIRIEAKEAVRNRGWIQYTGVSYDRAAGTARLGEPGCEITLAFEPGVAVEVAQPAPCIGHFEPSYGGRYGAGAPEPREYVQGGPAQQTVDGALALAWRGAAFDFSLAIVVYGVAHALNGRASLDPGSSDRFTAATPGCALHFTVGPGAIDTDLEVGDCRDAPYAAYWQLRR